jgi:hypothetical protein
MVVKKIPFIAVVLTSFQSKTHNKGAGVGVGGARGGGGYAPATMYPPFIIFIPLFDALSSL